MRMVWFLMACLLLPALAPAALVIQNGDMELWTGDMPNNWVKGTAASAQSTLLNTTSSAQLTAVSDNQSGIHYFRQVATSALSGYFYVTVDIAFEDAPTGRDFNLNLQNLTGSTYASVFNLRNEGAALSLYNGSAWVAIDSASLLKASNFTTNTINPYRIIIEGAWLGNYRLSIVDLKTGATILEKTGLNHYQSKTFSQFNVINFDLSRGASRILLDNLGVYSVQNPFLPIVDAGPNTTVALPANTLKLAPVVTNTGTPRENLTAVWTKVSGPAITFSSVSGETQNSLDAKVIFTGGRGEYVLKVAVTDQKGKTGEGTIRIRVKNPAQDDKLLAHWGFEDQPQASLAADMLDAAAGNTVADNGFLAPLAEPNSAPQWAEGWVGLGSLNYIGVGIVDVNDVVLQEPNLASLRWEISAAGWIKADPLTGHYQTVAVRAAPFNWVLRKGNNSNTGEFVINTDNGQLWAIGKTIINDGYWHHLAGTFDGQRAVLYVDGVEDASTTTQSLMSSVTTSKVSLGNRRDATNHNLKGGLDDVRIYSYALSPDQIVSLVRMGVNVPPHVQIADGIPTELIKQFNNTVNLNAVITDLNTEDTIGAQWSVVNSEQAAFVTFTNANAVVTSATFLQAGVYTLRLAINDGVAGLAGDIYDEITITVNEPVCDDILIFNQATGRYLNPLFSADISGQNGKPDCYVDLYDLAVLASEWLQCNDPHPDPEGPGCSPVLPL